MSNIPLVDLKAQYATIREEIDEAIARIVTNASFILGPEVHAFQELDFEFHHTMARAGENLALLLILNSVRELYLQFREMFSAVFANNAKTRLLYRRIVESLAAHDEKSSAELCSQLIEQGNQQFWSVGKPIGGGQ